VADGHDRPHAATDVRSHSKSADESRTTVKYEWTNTKETQTTTGISLAYAGRKAEGGYTKLVKKESGVTINVAKNNRYELQVNTEYRWYDLFCKDPMNTAGPWRDPKVSELRPYEWTGGSRKVNTTAISCPNSAYRQSIPDESELWVSRATSHTVANGIDVSGFDLNGSQKNTKSHKKTIKNTSTTVSATVCGQNNHPSKSDLVGEV
jgi:hypothetical protein